MEFVFDTVVHVQCGSRQFSALQHNDEKATITIFSWWPRLRERGRYLITVAHLILFDGNSQDILYSIASVL